MSKVTSSNISLKSWPENDLNKRSILFYNVTKNEKINRSWQQQRRQTFCAAVGHVTWSSAQSCPVGLIFLG